MKDDLYNAIVSAADKGEAFDGGDEIHEIDGDLIFIEIQNLWIKRLRLKQLNPARERRTLFFLRCEGIRIDSLEIDSGNAPSVGHMNDTGSLWIVGGDGHRVSNVSCFGDGKITHVSVHYTTNSRFENINVRLSEWVDPEATNDVQQGISFNADTDCTLDGARVVGVGQKFTRAIVGGGTRLTVRNFHVEGVDQGVDLTGSKGNLGCVVEQGKALNCLSWPVKLANSAVGCRVSDVVADNCGAFVASGPSENTQVHKTHDCEFIRCTSRNGRGVAGFRVMSSRFEHSYPHGVKFIDCVAEGSTPYGFHSEVPGNHLIGCRSEGHTVAMSDGFGVPVPPAKPIKKQESFPMAAVIVALVCGVIMLSLLL